MMGGETQSINKFYVGWVERSATHQEILRRMGPTHRDRHGSAAAAASASTSLSFIL